jgi:hypothetical protein
MELKNTNLVKSFRHNDDDWHEFFKNSNNVFYTYDNKKHDYENHVHLYIRREDGLLGYNIKKDGKSVESGIVDDDWKADDFREYYGRHAGGKKKTKRKTTKRKTKRKTTKRKTTKRKTKRKN